MYKEYILAAINQEQLKGAKLIAAKQNYIVFGTMYGDLLQQINVNRQEPINVFFYEPG